MKTFQEPVKIILKLMEVIVEYIMGAYGATITQTKHLSHIAMLTDMYLGGSHAGGEVQGARAAGGAPRARGSQTLIAARHLCVVRVGA